MTDQNPASKVSNPGDSLHGIVRLASSRHTADRAKFVFGQEMKACPKCSGYNLGYSTPIKLDEPMPTTAKGMLGAWARARKNGQTPLEGTCRIMCRECGHLGPAVDVTGRTSEDVGRDKAVADETKRLWNSPSNSIIEPHVAFAGKLPRVV